MSIDAPSDETIGICERAELAAWHDMWRGADPEVATALGLTSVQVGGAVALMATELDHLMFNRTIGLGLDPNVDRDDVSRLVEAYDQRQQTKYFLHLPILDKTEPIARHLEQLGLVPYHRHWAKFLRGNAPPRQAETSLDVVLAEAEHSKTVGEILGSCFHLPTGSEGLMASVIGCPDWRTFVALDEDRVAAVGLLHVENEVGQFCGAATLPEYRGRGAQAALMAARIAAGLELGCRWFVTETGEAVPGDPNHSYRNMQKAGFDVVYRRANYTRPGTTW